MDKITQYAHHSTYHILEENGANKMKEVKKKERRKWCGWKAIELFIN